jgi:hypothetical protein
MWGATVKELKPDLRRELWRLPRGEGTPRDMDLVAEAASSNYMIGGAEG